MVIPSQMGKMDAIYLVPFRITPGFVLSDHPYAIPEMKPGPAIWKSSNPCTIAQTHSWLCMNVHDYVCINDYALDTSKLLENN